MKFYNVSGQISRMFNAGGARHFSLDAPDMTFEDGNRVENMFVNVSLPAGFVSYLQHPPYNFRIISLMVNPFDEDANAVIVWETVRCTQITMQLRSQTIPMQQVSRVHQVFVNVTSFL